MPRLVKNAPEYDAIIKKLKKTPTTMQQLLQQTKIEKRS